MDSVWYPLEGIFAFLLEIATGDVLRSLGEKCEKMEDLTEGGVRGVGKMNGYELGK